MTGAVDEVIPTRWAVVGGDRVASGDVHRPATLYARIRNDGRTVRTDVEVVDREVAQGFELFIQDVLVDNRPTAVALFHGDARSPMWPHRKYLPPKSDGLTARRADTASSAPVALLTAIYSPFCDDYAPCIQQVASTTYPGGRRRV